MQIFIIIPTVGRAACVRQTVNWIERQTRRPDGVVVVGADPADIEGVDSCSNLPVDVLLWKKGSSAQRNHGLDRIEGRADIVVFLDDDFIPAPNYLEQVAGIFERSPELVGVTGRMISDGVHGLGISFGEAVALIERDCPPETPLTHPRRGLYGCNMSIRMATLDGVRFDERLPLYGWQEDIDFTFQLGKRGRLVCDERLAGVHMGIKSGRTSGKRFGYSQIANPVYLLKKQTIPRDRAYRIMWRNVASNMLRSIRPEAHIDRRGRLFGNMLAFRDLALGHLRPERITEF